MSIHTYKINNSVWNTSYFTYRT